TMKNVAGYDVAKLMIGSWGKLGVITQMTLRARRGNSPVYMGTIDNLSPLVLLDMALAISTAYDRPHSLILRRWNKNVELVLVALTVHQVEYAQWQAFQYGTQVSWEPVADYEDTIDQERLLLAEHAAKHGAFYEGGLLRSRLKDLLLQIRDSDSFTLFPGTGSWEVYADHALSQTLPGLTRHVLRGHAKVMAYHEWRPFIEKIERLWDPRKLFVSPWQ
ncbi:MAG: hypothetical protein C7B44_07315, partial [Sulfobacillus thermosulfidooxidans]